MLDSFIKKIQYKNRQRTINKKYKQDGLTDEVLDMQLELNKDRHENNISDSSKSPYGPMKQ